MAEGPLKNPRVLILIIAIVASLAAIWPTYQNGEFKTNLKYGLDLEGGSWLQLELQGTIIQMDADAEKVVKQEFSKLLNDPGLTVNEVTPTYIRFTTSADVKDKDIDSLGFGTSKVTKIGNFNNVTIQTNRNLIFQKFLENELKAEVIQVAVERTITFEIRKSASREEIESILKPVDGTLVSYRKGVTSKTRDDTKDILDNKLNNFGLKEIPIRAVGDNYLLIDLAGIDIATARRIAATPGKFEIRIQVEGNRTEHVLYGDQIEPGETIEQQKGGAWGVPFRLKETGANALRDAAIKYKAVNEPERHYLSMYLDEKMVYNAPLSPDLARDIQRIAVTSLVATTGMGSDGQEKAKELWIHLRSGALPVNVEVIGSGQVSASLGQKFKEQVAIAGIIALVAVALIVYMRYKHKQIVLPMLSASFSEVIIILGFAAAVGWQLDLPSLTGIIAVIGTGVDHLIIITDEVLAGGSGVAGKVYTSRISKAFAIIFAAAATVVVAMAPLLFMGFGSLKGFAIVTIVGVLIGVGIARPAYAAIIESSLRGTIETEEPEEQKPVHVKGKRQKPAP